MIYIKGDFTSSLDAAIKDSQKEEYYVLTTNNCVWKSLECIQKGYELGTQEYNQIDDLLWATGTSVKNPLTGVYTSYKFQKTLIPNQVAKKLPDILSDCITYIRN